MQAITTSETKQQIGVPVEDFRLPALTGEQVSLQTILNHKRGAVVVFWSSICSHCARYDAYLNGFPWQYPKLGIVAVASRHNEPVEQIRMVVAQRKLTFPILHDQGGKVARRWFTQQTPRVFLVDANRILRYRGAFDNYKYPGDPEYIPYLEPAIAEFLAGKPVTRSETASFGCAIQSIYYDLPKNL